MRPHLNRPAAPLETGEQAQLGTTEGLIALRRRRGLQWPRSTDLIVDIAFVVTLILTLAGVTTVLSFHLSFALLTVMSFSHTGKQFLWRGVPGVALITITVAVGVRQGTLPADELYELPILVMMMVVAAWSMQFHGRLLGELSAQGNRLRQLHAATQLEYRDQLVLAQRLETFGQLSAGVAHNLRNLLTTVLSMAERIEDESEDETIKESARRIQAHTEQGGELITNMLHHARPNQETVSVDLSATVINEHSSLDILIGPDIELVLDVSDEPLHVQTSQSLLEQVLVNLVVNARDAIDGKGRITVTVKPGELAGPHPNDATLDAGVLSVTDTGHGISPDARLRAFEPFFTTKDEQEGAGLGLYSALVIAEDAGGTISISPHRQVGTEIVVTLPLATTDTEQANRYQFDLRPESFFGTERVLVVDDDRVIRERLCTTLTLYGYEVVSAKNGVAALSKLDEGPFDLLVTDIIMPELNGPDLVEQAQLRGLGGVVLFTSAYEEAASMIPADADLLPKPFSRNMFMARVRRTLDTAETALANPVR
jgi:signal transduction histidine kinase/ActR/RegA family two-component response regulator